MPRAAIDVGSNSMLLTVLDDDDAILHDEARVVGLGKQLGDGGRFLDDRMADARRAFVDYADTARRLGVDAAAVRVIATSASRRASNANAFFEAIRTQTGLRVEVISGDEEARLTWLGARNGLTQLRFPTLIADLGGGSTELAFGDEALRHARSLELGSSRLTERFGLQVEGPIDEAALVDCRRFVDATLATFPLAEPVQDLVGVAGTVTTLRAVAAGLEVYDSATVHDSVLTRSELGSLLTTLVQLDRPGRLRYAAVSPKRADFLAAGAVVLLALLDYTGLDRLRVSDRGIRFGALARPAA